MRTAPKYILILSRFALAMLLMQLVGTTHAATVVYPEFSFDDTWAREPFALNELNLTSCRYQQVYDASRFAAVLPDGLTITQILFVVDNEFPRGFYADFPDIQIDLSVTPRGPDQLSTNFSDNLGTNTVAVLPRGRLNMVSSGLAGTPIPINLPVAYFYNPAFGNLLLDVRIFLPNPRPNPFGNPGVFDAFNSGSDSVSRVFSPNVNSPTGVADTTGLKTIFKVIPPAIPRLLFYVSSSTIETNLVLWWWRAPVAYTLQQSPALGSGASWQPYSGIVFSHQEYLEARVPVNRNDTARFFRLVSQTPPSGSAGVQSDMGASALSNQER